MMHTFAPTRGVLTPSLDTVLTETPDARALYALVHDDTVPAWKVELAHALHMVELSRSEYDGYVEVDCDTCHTYVLLPNPDTGVMDPAVFRQPCPLHTQEG